MFPLTTTFSNEMATPRKKINLSEHMIPLGGLDGMYKCYVDRTNRHVANIYFKSAPSVNDLPIYEVELLDSNGIPLVTNATYTFDIGDFQLAEEMIESYVSDTLDYSLTMNTEHDNPSNERLPSNVQEL